MRGLIPVQVATDEGSYPVLQKGMQALKALPLPGFQDFSPGSSGAPMTARGDVQAPVPAEALGCFSGGPVIR